MIGSLEDCWRSDSGERKREERKKKADRNRDRIDKTDKENGRCPQGIA